MSEKWNLIVDVANCTNCQLCALSTQDEHVENEFPNYAAPMPKHGARWIEIEKLERGNMPMIDMAYVPVMCQHCDDAPCIKLAENGAITKREDGIVIIDPIKAKGQKKIVDACPYNAIKWNEEEELPQHWIFDAHLLDSGWPEPRAVTVCGTDALRAVKISDAEREKLIQSEQLEELNPGANTKPRVLYKNLSRYNKCFIGGVVTQTVENSKQCIENCQIEIWQNESLIAEGKTNLFGDFKIDNLAPESGDYEIRIQTPDGVESNHSFNLGLSQYLGEFIVD